MYKISYGSKRGKKVWINAVKMINDDSWYHICIELNVIDNENKITWINKMIEGKDNFLDTLGTEEDNKIINQAIEYATKEGYLKSIIKKYK